MGHRSLWKDEQWWPDRHMDLNWISPFLHQISMHYYYEFYCAMNYREYDRFKCARAIALVKKHDDFDKIMDFDRSYFGYHDKHET